MTCPHCQTPLLRLPHHRLACSGRGCDCPPGDPFCPCRMVAERQELAVRSGGYVRRDPTPEQVRERAVRAAKAAAGTTGARRAVREMEGGEGRRAER